MTFADPSSPPRVIAVLGMHRSGTSWLAGSLEELGLDLGEVSTSDPHNRKGNRESPVLMELHEGVLRSNGGSWKRPSFPNRWSAEQTAELRAFVASMDAAGRPWGFKDPRALMMLDAWRAAVGERMQSIGVFRHPLAVHGSLHARNPRFTESRSVKLWHAYNERVVAEMEARPFPLLRFDVPPDRLVAALAAACAALDLDGGRSDSFFDRGLVHNNEAAELPVPRKCRSLWAALCAGAIEG